MIKPDDFNSIDDTIDEVNLKKARQAFQDMRKYQDLWAEHGSDRVYEVYDDVEGDWLKDFEPINAANDLKDMLREMRDCPGVDVGEAE